MEYNVRDMNRRFFSKGNSVRSQFFSTTCRSGEGGPSAPHPNPGICTPENTYIHEGVCLSTSTSERSVMPQIDGHWLLLGTHFPLMVLCGFYQSLLPEICLGKLAAYSYTTDDRS
jgi:hypothetical protein